MKKLIAVCLALTILCAMVGCGKAQDGTAAQAPQSNTTKDLMLYNSLELAKLVGNAVMDDYAEKIGLSGDAAALCEVFSAAADPSQVTAGAIVRADKIDLALAITSANSQLGIDATVCTGGLSFSTRFQLGNNAFGHAGVYLQYGEDCHLIVELVSVENGLVTAIVRPLMKEAAQIVLDDCFSNATKVSKAELDASYTACMGSSAAAKPTGAATIDTYYTDMAIKLFADTKQPQKDAFKEFATYPELIEKAWKMSKYLTSPPSGRMVYQFPEVLDADLPTFTSDSVKNLYLQQLYLSWPNTLCASTGANSIVLSSILNTVMTFGTPGIAASAEEGPIMVALDYTICTALVVFYPNESNVYMSSITFLPCDFSQACDMLEHAGAESI